MADIYSNQEDRMEEALDAIYDDFFISASAAAKHFSLKPRRVQYRLCYGTYDHMGVWLVMTSLGARFSVLS